MAVFKVEGGHRLRGEITPQGAKNEALQILCATLLTPQRVVVRNIPRILDVMQLIELLRCMGVEVEQLAEDAYAFCARDIDFEYLKSDDYRQRCTRLRGSVMLIGPMLARFGVGYIPKPGGDKIGRRRLDTHFLGFQKLGAKFNFDIADEFFMVEGRELKGTYMLLDEASVTGTANIVMAAVLAKGSTTIYNAAREPEIVDLQNFINAMGGNVRGAGGSIITVEGRRALHGGKYRIIADRIVGATYLCAAACCGGEVRLRGVDPRPLSTVSGALSEAGCTVKSGEDDVFLQSDGSLRSIRPVRTAPYPGFPTDAQPVLMAALLKSAGSTVFVENIFENRYRHVDELARMGAEVRVAGRVAVVTGREHLHGARVKCTDLRAGAALVIAGLQADGLTRISRIEHIDRGYESIERDLGVLGAHVRRETGT